MHKNDLVLINLQWLICHKTQETNHQTGSSSANLRKYRLCVFFRVSLAFYSRYIFAQNLGSCYV